MKEYMYNKVERVYCRCDEFTLIQRWIRRTTAGQQYHQPNDENINVPTRTAYTRRVYVYNYLSSSIYTHTYYTHVFYSCCILWIRYNHRKTHKLCCATIFYTRYLFTAATVARSLALSAHIFQFYMLGPGLVCPYTIRYKTYIIILHAAHIVHCSRIVYYNRIDTVYNTTQVTQMAKRSCAHTKNREKKKKKIKE